MTTATLPQAPATGPAGLAPEALPGLEAPPATPPSPYEVAERCGAAVWNALQLELTAEYERLAPGSTPCLTSGTGRADALLEHIAVSGGRAGAMRVPVTRLCRRRV